MSITALELIRGALRLIGEDGESETVSAETAINGLLTLNEMLDAWALKRFMVFQIVGQTLQCTPGDNQITIGPGGDFAIERPIKLEPGCILRDEAQQDYELTVLSDKSAYDRLSHKSTTSHQPTAIFYQPSFPVGSLFIWPIPDKAYTIIINSRLTIFSFPTLTTQISLPPGYQQCIRYNLAICLAPEFGGVSVPAEVVAIARDSMVNMSQINSPRLVSRCETAFISRGRRDYDIVSGEYLGGQ